MPVYVIWGEFDHLIPMQTRDCIIQRYHIPKERTHVFEKAAHAVNVEHVDEFVDWVTGMMQSEY
jgi:pimeloyl-ACP methyl ester carboxylesterase